MAIRTDFTAGEVLAAADLNDTFAAKANLASPTFTGTPAGPTAASGTNTTQLATTAFARTAGGLVLVASQTFSAVSSVSVNACFTSTYANYRIIIDPTASVGIDANMRMRLRASGTDATTAYTSQRVYGTGTTVAANRDVDGTDFMTLGGIDATYATENLTTLDICGPQLAAATTINVHAYQRNSGGVPVLTISSSSHATASAYDGFTISTTGTSITGTVRIYGYLNS